MREARQGKGVVRSGSLADDRHSWLALEKHAKAGPHDHVVVDEQDADDLYVGCVHAMLLQKDIDDHHSIFRALPRYRYPTPRAAARSAIARGVKSASAPPAAPSDVTEPSVTSWNISAASRSL